jgi:hypothetical protein
MCFHDVLLLVIDERLRLSFRLARLGGVWIVLIKVSNQNGSNGYYRLTWLVVLAIQAFLMRDEESYRLLPLLHPPLVLGVSCFSFAVRLLVVGVYDLASWWLRWWSELVSDRYPVFHFIRISSVESSLVSTKKLIHDSKTLTSKGPNLEVKKKSPCEEQVSSSNTTIPCIHESMYKSMYKVRFLPMLVLGEAGPSREMSPFYREGIMQIPRF